MTLPLAMNSLNSLSMIVPRRDSTLRLTRRPGRTAGSLRAGCAYNQKMPISLTTRERAHLKARAHAMEPRVQIGKTGLTDAVVSEIDRALKAHELIKVKILADRDERDAIAAAMCERADAALVQQVGKIAILWRPKPDETPE